MREGALMIRIILLVHVVVVELRVERILRKFTSHFRYLPVIPRRASLYRQRYTRPITCV